MTPSMQVGQRIIVDEFGQKSKSICEFGCDHDVLAITRRALTITEATIKSPWPNVPPEHKHAYPAGYASYVAVETDGTIWSQDALGSGSRWESGERRADTVNIHGHIAGGYGRKNSSPFVFTNLTDVGPPARSAP